MKKRPPRVNTCILDGFQRIAKAVRVYLALLLIAPTEDESGNLKSHFFVVLVFVYSKGVVVRIKIPLEVARTTHMVSRGWGLGRKFWITRCSVLVLLPQRVGGGSRLLLRKFAAADVERLCQEPPLRRK